MNTATSASNGPTRDQHAESMAAYRQEGVRLAEEIGNRGPVRFDADGRLHPDILAAYWRHGFYIFEGVVGPDEVQELRREATVMLERAPVRPGAEPDAQGPHAPGLASPPHPYTPILPPSPPWRGT